tara:strand:+ start:310 stop:792 length:483 start_codon:yes stop_codon:yes gene_type:complete
MNNKTLYSISEEYLNNYSIDNPPLISLYRDYYIQEEYDKYRSSDKFFIFVDNIKEVLETQDSILQLNDFPYYTSNNIKHYVLWINNKRKKNTPQNKNLDKLDKLFIKNEINKYFDINIKYKKKKEEYPIIENIITYWVNTIQNCSITDILHIHIFTKPID